MCLPSHPRYYPLDHHNFVGGVEVSDPDDVPRIMDLIHHKTEEVVQAASKFGDLCQLARNKDGKVILSYALRELSFSLHESYGHYPLSVCWKIGDGVIHMSLHYRVEDDKFRVGRKWFDTAEEAIMQALVYKRASLPGSIEYNRKLAAGARARVKASLTFLDKLNQVI